MTKAIDRRPWLILSRREALALQALAHGRPVHTPVLQRALNNIERQVAWIDGTGTEPVLSEDALKEEAAANG